MKMKAIKGGKIVETYRTTQIAKMIGVHPNTIRFYEQMKLLPVIPRTDSGYRIFNERHVEQLRLLRTAFKAEIISNKLRHEVYEIIKTSAKSATDDAYQLTQKYLEHLCEEKEKAEEAINSVINSLETRSFTSEEKKYKSRLDIAKTLDITVDVLRNWERNGLISIPKNAKGQREYGLNEINRLKIIRILRNAHYSMMSILRMLNRLDQGEVDVRQIIDTPHEDEDIICAADRYITALTLAEKDALEMLNLLDAMRKRSPKQTEPLY